VFFEDIFKLDFAGSHIKSFLDCLCIVLYMKDFFTSRFAIFTMAAFAIFDSPHLKIMLIELNYLIDNNY